MVRRFGSLVDGYLRRLFFGIATTAGGAAGDDRRQYHHSYHMTHQQLHLQQQSRHVDIRTPWLGLTRVWRQDDNGGIWRWLPWRLRERQVERASGDLMV
jgi:hypothetical protein